jgi:hypothetical protein
MKYINCNDTFRFHQYSPFEWNGYYRTTKKKDNVFHVWSDCGDVPAIEWTRESETARCPAVDSISARELANAINSIKVKQTFQERGSFVINEFGYVIVPFSNTDKKYCVGKIEGSLIFHNPFESGYFSLNDDEHLKTGDLWVKPYIGIPYIFSPDYGVYYKNEDWSMKNRSVTKPVKQDPELMRKIRSITGTNTVRFIVNPHGIALIKPETEWGKWTPIYIGRINYEKWFTS